MHNVEEYSIMKNLAAHSLLTNCILNKENTTIDICGIAGDVCVMNTVKDLIKYKYTNITILTQYIANVKDIKPLIDLAIQNNLTVI